MAGEVDAAAQPRVRVASPNSSGDIGEAFVHEWLTAVLGADYGPDCWVSESRERYGLPKSGKDGLGYDFKVPDPNGRLFGIPAAAYLIEVKSTTTDGSGVLPDVERRVGSRPSVP